MYLPRSRAEIVELQYLRAIAVLMVVVGHAHQAATRFLDGDLFGPAGYVGFTGVDVFFVISGFIIHTLYGDAVRPTADYALKRLNRIYPLYWLFTALAVAGYFTMGSSLSQDIGGLDWLTSATLWPTGQLPILQVGWTLTHELYFYLVYGLVLVLPPRWRGLAALTWAGLTALAMADILATGSPLARLALSPFNLLFLAGVLLAELRSRLPRTRGLATAVAATGLTLAIAWLWPRGLDGLAEPTLRVLVCMPLAVGLVWALIAWQPRWPAWIAAIGDWSYAIYLGHILVIGVLARLFADILPSGLASAVVLLGTSLAASILLGALVHRWLEQPLLVAGKRLIARLTRHE